MPFVDEIDERIQQWERLRISLAGQMREEAKRIVSPGTMPAEELESRIEEYSEALLSLRTALGLGAESGDSVVKEIDTRRQLLTRASQACRQLNRIQGIQLLSGDLSILDPVRSQAESLIDHLERSPWENLDVLEQIETRRHQLCRLVDLLQESESLPDDVWTREINGVQEQWGTPLATAISRGRVHFVSPE